jgi:hypothetical protein
MTGTNAVRQKHTYGRLPNLKGSAELDAAACTTCQKMMDNNLLAHELRGRNGRVTKASQRVSAAGYNWRATAENILFYKGYGGPNAARAVKQWEDSPGHLKNMLGDYQHQGACACVDSDNTVYFAQEFGSGSGNSGAYTCGAESSPAPVTRQAPQAPQAPAPPSKGTISEDTTRSYTPQPQPQSTGNLPASNKTGPHGRPCVASSYGNKSVGAELKKRELQSKSKKSLNGVISIVSQ